MTRLKAHDDSAWRNNSFKFEEVNALNCTTESAIYVMELPEFKL